VKRKILSIFVLALSVCFVLTSCDTSSLGKDTNSSSSTKEVSSSISSKTDNHVMYRVAPVFKGNNLVASGVQMEGYSVEDKGKEISFNVYAYNVQPNIKIDYATGDSSYNGVSAQPITQKPKVKKKVKSTPTYSYNTGGSDNQSSIYILNTSSKKFHVPSCSAVSRMKDSNKQTYTGSRSSLISQGYVPCKIYNP
jgi:DNA-entry nuclease